MADTGMSIDAPEPSLKRFKSGGILVSRMSDADIACTVNSLAKLNDESASSILRRLILEWMHDAGRAEKELEIACSAIFRVWPNPCPVLELASDVMASNKFAGTIAKLKMFEPMPSSCTDAFYTHVAPLAERMFIATSREGERLWLAEHHVAGCIKSMLIAAKSETHSFLFDSVVDLMHNERFSELVVKADCCFTPDDLAAHAKPNLKMLVLYADFVLRHPERLEWLLSKLFSSRYTDTYERTKMAYVKFLDHILCRRPLQQQLVKSLLHRCLLCAEILRESGELPRFVSTSDGDMQELVAKCLVSSSTVSKIVSLKVLQSFHGSALATLTVGLVRRIADCDADVRGFITHAVESGAL